MGLGAASVEDAMKGMIEGRRKRLPSQDARSGLEKSPVPNITEIYGFAIFSFTIISYGIFIANKGRETAKIQGILASRVPE